MTTNHTDAGPIPSHGKHQLGTYRLDAALRVALWCALAHSFPR